MKPLYWLCLFSAAAFLVWAHTHTDELPIVLGFVLITGALLGVIFPRQFPMTGLVIGAAVFVAETLVHFSVLHAPYPASAGIPWVALVAYVPATVGVALGAGLRRIAGQ